MGSLKIYAGKGCGRYVQKVSYVDNKGSVDGRSLACSMSIGARKLVWSTG